MCAFHPLSSGRSKKDERCSLAITSERVGLYLSIIVPSISVLFHYYHVPPLAKRGWVSLTSVQDCCLFKPYSESFKDFKTKYFKIIIKEGGRNQFRDAAGEPLFPYHWTEDPAKINPVLTDNMTPADVEAVKTINDLPHRLHARQLVDCLRHEDFINVAFDTILVFVHVFLLILTWLNFYFFCRCYVVPNPPPDKLCPPFL